MSAPLPPEDLAELRALLARLPWLRGKPFAWVLAHPVVLRCLQNALEAARRERARQRDRAAREATTFHLEG